MFLLGIPPLFLPSGIIVANALSFIWPGIELKVVMHLVWTFMAEWSGQRQSNLTVNPEQGVRLGMWLHRVSYFALREIFNSLILVTV